ncbi:MAG: glycosyltransferase family 39 protein [Anaerolineae bacterium]
MAGLLRRARPRQILIIAFACGLLFLCGQLKAPANFYDEGLVLVNAERIRRGEVIYRDFWTLYSPGYFYALAGLFSLVAPNILIARLFDTALRFLLTLGVYALARPLTSWRAALLPWALVTFWLGTIRFYSYPAFPATGAIILTALVFRRYLLNGRARWLLAAGAALGLTALLRLDFGGYAAAGFGAALACHEVRSAREAGVGRRGWPGRVLRAEALLAAGALAVALPVYLPLGRAAGFATLYEDLVHFPATTFRAVRYLPVPPLIPDFGKINGLQWNDWLRLYLPLGTFAAGLIAAIRRLFWRPVPRADVRYQAGILLVALVGAGLGLAVKATSRYHELHALPMTFCAAIVATVLLHRLPRHWRQSVPFRIAAGGLAFLLLTGPYFLHFALLAQMNAASPLGCYSTDPRAGCVPLDRNQAAVAAYIRSQTRPDEYVFIGNTRHDKIFVNDLMLYFLIDRPIPTRYAELHPGLATTLPVQQAIAAELAARDVRWVVLAAAWESREPNASALSSGVTYLDDYIHQHYQPVASFGNYRVWQAKEEMRSP